MRSMEIREDDLTSRKIANLLREHLAGMAQASPPESMHALTCPTTERPIEASPPSSTR